MLQKVPAGEISCRYVLFLFTDSGKEQTVISVGVIARRCLRSVCRGGSIHRSSAPDLQIFKS